MGQRALGPHPGGERSPPREPGMALSPGGQAALSSWRAVGDPWRLQPDTWASGRGTAVLEDKGARSPCLEKDGRRQPGRCLAQ